VVFIDEDLIQVSEEGLSMFEEGFDTDIHRWEKATRGENALLQSCHLYFIKFSKRRPLRV